MRTYFISLEKYDFCVTDFTAKEKLQKNFVRLHLLILAKLEMHLQLENVAS